MLQLAVGSLLSSAGCGIIPTLDQIILRPSSSVRGTPADYGYPYEELTLPVAQDRSIVLWYVHAEQPRGLVLVLPGSDSNKSRYVLGLPVFVPKNYDVILPDYEGFGASPGEPTLPHCADDTRALGAYALSRSSRVVIYSASLGTPLAVRLAADNEFAGCIFEGTFILKEEPALWLKDRGVDIPFLGDVAGLYVNPQTPDEYDILKYIGSVAEPKLFVHSVEDDVVPYASGRKVFDAAPEPKEFWDMRGEHGKMIELEPDLYRERIGAWLDALP